MHRLDEISHSIEDIKEDLFKIDRQIKEESQARILHLERLIITGDYVILYKSPTDSKISIKDEFVREIEEYYPGTYQIVKKTDLI